MGEAGTWEGPEQEQAKDTLAEATSVPSVGCHLSGRTLMVSRHYMVHSGLGGPSSHSLGMGDHWSQLECSFHSQWSRDAKVKGPIKQRPGLALEEPGGKYKETPGLLQASIPLSTGCSQTGQRACGGTKGQQGALLMKLCVRRASGRHQVELWGSVFRVLLCSEHLSSCRGTLSKFLWLVGLGFPICRAGW